MTARTYKEIIVGISAAAEALREHERERAAELAVQLVDLDAAMLAAGERAALTRLGVELQWETAMDVLWAEAWMTLRLRPEPDPRADPADIDALDAAVEERATALLEAVRRRRFGWARG